MPSASSRRDSPLSLDLTNECLRCEGQAIPLRPKTFAVLQCLRAHVGQLVSKDLLLDTVWPETTVSEAVLAVCVRELRRALRDDSRAPQFIETVHRRGYRFIGSLPVYMPPESLAAWPGTAASLPLCVARERELAQLQHWLTIALRGVRQVGFITGEAGLGKTTLVDTFVTRLQGDELWIGYGQCVEHCGAGEAYLPILEALGRLCRGSDGHDLVALLAQQAPTWLVHMPGLLSPADLEALQRQIWGASRERMLREFAELVEHLTAWRPLLLVLEDLHWSDASTLDLLATLARRREPARFLLLGTYRPAEVVQHEQPLRAVVAELVLHGQCRTLPLAPLPRDAVGDYLVQRLSTDHVAAEMTQRLYQRTEGNPLFMGHVVADWLSQGVLEHVDGHWTLQAACAPAAHGVPEPLQQMLEQYLEHCSPAEQQVLEVGSVAGMEFSAATVAAGLGHDLLQVETCCALLARRKIWLESIGEQSWPDGTIAACYRFTHALCQEVAYSRVTAARRVHLHRRIGERLEAGYGARARDMAAELAMHFEQGREAPRALVYLRQAADKAQQRYAHAETIHYLRRALVMLETLPDTTERATHELAVHAALGPALMALKGYAAPEVVQAYSRAFALCSQVGDTRQRFDVLLGLCTFYQEKAELQTAQTLAEQLVSLAQRLHDPVCLLWAHSALGYTLYYQGELVQARAHMEESLELYLTHRPGADGFVFDPGVDILGALVDLLYYLGYPEQALRRSQEAVTLARELGHPFSLAHALSFATRLHRWRGEHTEAQAAAEARLALCHAQGFTQEAAEELVWSGRELVQQGQVDAGLAQMRQGLETVRTTGAETRRPWLLTALARAYGQAGCVDAGLAVLEEALDIVEKTGKRLDEVGLYRTKGELLLHKSQQSQDISRRALWLEAEGCFQQALAVARQQQARTFELRAAVSLARLWQQQGKPPAAHQLLAPIYAWFTEGLDTADLREARGVLAALA